MIHWPLLQFVARQTIDSSKVGCFSNQESENGGKYDYELKNTKGFRLHHRTQSHQGESGHSMHFAAYHIFCATEECQKGAFQYGMFDFHAPDGYLYLTLCAP